MAARAAVAGPAGAERPAPVAPRQSRMQLRPRRQRLGVPLPQSPPVAAVEGRAVVAARSPAPVRRFLPKTPNAGGYPGAPYFKITVAGTDRALAATAEGELTTAPAFTGSPEQLWAIQQLTDGSYRISPKSVSGSKEPLALSAIGNSFATLAKFNPESSRQRWNLKGL